MNTTAIIIFLVFWSTSLVVILYTMRCVKNKDADDLRMIKVMGKSMLEEMAQEGNPLWAKNLAKKELRLRNNEK